MEVGGGTPAKSDPPVSCLHFLFSVVSLCLFSGRCIGSGGGGGASAAVKTKQLGRYAQKTAAGYKK